MARTIGSNFSTQLSSTQVRPFYAIEFNYPTPLRIWTGYSSFSIFSQDYLGLGNLITVSNIQETGETKASGITVSASGLDTSILSSSFTQTQQGVNVKLYFGVLRAIDNWKAAWENKDMEGYLSSYDSNFQYPNNMSKPDWEQYRTSRIISKKTINISLSNIELKFGKNKITATFIQNYKSGALNQTSNKTLVLVGNEGDWLILSEASE